MEKLGTHGFQLSKQKNCYFTITAFQGKKKKTEIKYSGSLYGNGNFKSWYLTLALFDKRHFN